MNDQAVASTTSSPARQTGPADPPAPLAANLRDLWTLDPAVAFVNHGSFGATPRSVLAEQQKWRDLLEREPVHFFVRATREPHDAALECVGRLIGCDGGDLGFVTNATEGVHAIVRSMSFAPADEIITTAHAYDAVANLLEHVSKRTGAKLHRVPIDLPFDEDRFVHAVLEKLSERTRLVVVDHVTSISGLILPIERLVRACDERGVDIVIDGAHGPGMLEIDLRTLRPTYYTGNLHKWVCAPKGAAFLYVRKDRQDRIHPSTISNNYGRGFRDEFAWQGTRDITPWLSTPAAIAFFEPFGWQAVRRHNHLFVQWVLRFLCETWGVEPICKAEQFGSMVTIPLPAGAAKVEDRNVAMDLLYERFRIEALVVDVNGRRMIRPSCQLYNAPEDYERLAKAVQSLWM